MTLYLGSITARGGRTKSSATGALIADYMDRARRYIPVESLNFPDEDSLFTWVDRGKGRTGCFVVLLDSSGREFSSEEIASLLTKLREDGQQRVLLAIGPANGWSETSRRRGNILLSLAASPCRMSLPQLSCQSRSIAP